MGKYGDPSGTSTNNENNYSLLRKILLELTDDLLPDLGFTCRRTLTAACVMKFYFYPFDRHYCTLDIESCKLSLKDNKYGKS